MGVLFKLVGYGTRLYWRLVKPVTVGVRALVENHNGQILLVKHSYSSLWYLPGGGVHKKEHLRDALARELKEEIGLQVAGDVALLATYANFREYKSDFVSVFIVKDFTINPIENKEIAEWQFFDWQALPSDVSAATRRRLDEYFDHRVIDYKW